ncbi:hypothetical protein AA313_de0207279 [Arthrobotrys entomopaga]|nr:hypothetical protein AA313_de0207279 [Arthrobotrys entomopaga]
MEGRLKMVWRGRPGWGGMRGRFSWLLLLIVYVLRGGGRRSRSVVISVGFPPRRLLIRMLFLRRRRRRHLHPPLHRRYWILRRWNRQRTLLHLPMSVVPSTCELVLVPIRSRLLVPSLPDILIYSHKASRPFQAIVVILLAFLPLLLRFHRLPYRNLHLSLRYY